MRGLVKTDINERQRPGVNATIVGHYNAGAFVEITESVWGNSFDGNDLWYKLKNGNYLWSGGVDAEVDCSKLPEEDQKHYLISYREVRSDGRPDMDSRKAPRQLYFTPVRLPAESESIRVNTLITPLFVNSVMQAVAKTRPAQKHVFIYIHGYQMFSSLKLDLLSGFVLNHLTQSENSIAKVMFFTWPAQSLSRKRVDDRAIEMGKQFTADNLFEPFTELSKALATQGKFLNLVVHSFGNQLLNGMVNPDPVHVNKIPTGIFENIFLMAPDVTHLTAKQGGVDLRNVFEDNGIKQFHYEFSKLTQLAKNVHVFHDKYDYLLYSSTKKFIEKSNANSFSVSRDYRNLGNYGKLAPDMPGSQNPELAANQVVPRLTFHDVDDIVDKGEAGDLYDFPFQRINDRSSGDKVKEVWDTGNYGGINAFKIILNASRFANHHRYLFMCKPIVDKVVAILNGKA